MSTATASYKGHRYPVEIINHCVWLYFRFPLSFREVEELMLVRGVVVSYETIRRWCAKFGQAYANQLRRRRPRPGDKWHLDEVFVKINGITGYLWRAVDQHGNVLDVLRVPGRSRRLRPGSNAHPAAYEAACFRGFQWKEASDRTRRQAKLAQVRGVGNQGSSPGRNCQLHLSVACRYASMLAGEVRRC